MNWKKTTVVMLRHVAPDAPMAIYGKTNVHAAPDKLKKINQATTKKYRKIFVSPLLRAQETAKATCQNANYSTVKELTEFDFGPLDGKPFSSYTNDDQKKLNILNQAGNLFMNKNINTSNLDQGLSELIMQMRNFKNNFFYFLENL